MGLVGLGVRVTIRLVGLGLGVRGEGSVNAGDGKYLMVTTLTSV